MFLLVGGILVILTGPSSAAEMVRAPADSSGTLTVGSIWIDRRPIFSAEEARSGTFLLGGMRRLMNGVHTTTRRGVIQQELLFKTGDPFRPALLAETERNLRQLGFLNDIAVSPIDTTPAGVVDVLVSTRDSWTLKTDFSYAQASSGDTRWNVQLSDTNFLGYGVTAGAGVGADENSSYWNLWYRQRRFFGTPFLLKIDESERRDGYVREVLLNRPFWSEGDRWSVHGHFWDLKLGRRYYLSNGGRGGDDPGRAASLYILLPRQEKGVELGGLLRVHGMEHGRIWRPGLGVRWTETHDQLGTGPWVLSDGRSLDLQWLADPGQPLWRSRGTTVWSYFWVQTRGRGWIKDRFIMKYGTTEDIDLTPFVELKAGPELSALGTTTVGGRDRWRAEGVGEQWAVAGPGLFMVRGEGKVVWGDPMAAYHRVSLLAGWIAHLGSRQTPWMSRVFAEYGHGKALDGTQAFALGLERGLRTLDFDGMVGDRLARFTAEEGKVLPGEIFGVMRYGLAVFFATGSAWWQDEGHRAADVRREIGLGLRFGPVRSSNAAIGRLDLVWDVQNGGGPVVTATTRGYF